MMKHGIICALAYAVVALVTFGVSASDPAHNCPVDDEYCVQGEISAVSGLVAGLLWPLYWTWTIADAARGTERS